MKKPPEWPREWFSESCHKTHQPWMRQLEMKKNEIREFAGLIGFEGVKNEVEKEKSLERWAKRATIHFTKKVKRMLFQEIDNICGLGMKRYFKMVPTKQSV